MKNKENTNRPESKEEERKPNLASELWFKGNDDSALENIREHLKNGDFFSTIRLGDRTEMTESEKGGYKPGEFVSIKTQHSDGLFDTDTVDALITSTEIKKLSELTNEDIKKAVLDAVNIDDLKQRLTKLYGREISENETITIVNFEFEKNLVKVADLIRLKVLKPAELPTDNPDNIDFDSYTIPLIEHDYPAKTPVMWNAAYKKFGLNTANVMMVGNPRSARQILNVMKKDPKYRGGGAGVGFKDEAVKFIELDPLAEAVGSVNFIKKTENGELRGYNTDGIGYAESLEEMFREDLAGSRIVLLGAGGTGNSVAFALANKEATVIILNRTKEKAKELAEKINKFEGREVATYGGEDEIAKSVTDADAIINVSTKGAAGDLEPYSALAPARLPATAENIAQNISEAQTIMQTIPKTTVLSDIVLTKKGTPFLNAAKQNGFRTLDGVPMVINQGVEAFWLLHSEELTAKGISKEELAETMREAAGQK